MRHEQGVVEVNASGSHVGMLSAATAAGGIPNFWFSSALAMDVAHQSGVAQGPFAAGMQQGVGIYLPSPLGGESEVSTMYDVHVSVSSFFGNDVVVQVHVGDVSERSVGSFPMVGNVIVGSHGYTRFAVPSDSQFELGTMFLALGINFVFDAAYAKPLSWSLSVRRMVGTRRFHNPLL
jgi:hypothetical protein